MTDKILLVDDDSNVLSAYTRNLRRKFPQLTTADCGDAGLKALERDGPFSVVVSDMHMPGMNGIAFLQAVKARSPDTVRMMLTGQADLSTAMDAVNQGSIFRFYTKPCPPEALADAIETGVRQYSLVTAERVLLERTLAGSVKVLVDVLSLVRPEAFGITARVRPWMRRLGQELKYGSLWELDMAAMLSPLGQITLPDETLAKLYSGEHLGDTEKAMVERSPEVARNLISNIPRLEQVGKIIYYHRKGYDGSGFPADKLCGVEIPPGARLLRILLDLAEAEKLRGPGADAFAVLERKSFLYDPAILKLSRQCLLSDDEGSVATATDAAGVKHIDKRVTIELLLPEDRILADIVSLNGSLVLASGHVLTPSLIERLHNLHRLTPLKEPVLVSRLMKSGPETAATAA